MVPQGKGGVAALGKTRGRADENPADANQVSNHIQKMQVTCTGCGAENRVDLERSRAAVPVCGRCKAALPVEAPGHPIDADERTFADMVLGVKVPVVVDFWAAWCGPCRMMAPTFEAVAREMAGRARFVRVDVDANPSLARQVGASSIPLLVVYRDGHEVRRASGVQSAERLRRLMT